MNFVIGAVNVIYGCFHGPSFKLSLFKAGRCQAVKLGIVVKIDERASTKLVHWQAPNFVGKITAR